MIEINDILSGLGYVLIVVGLAGAVLPILPGPLLIWLGALLWAWGDGFERIGWITLLLLGILALAAWVSDLFLTTVISRRAGASWKSIGGAIIGGIAGGILLSGVLVVGAVLGAIVGAVVGMWLIEYWDKRNAVGATNAVRAYLGSMAAAAALEVTIAVIMISIFVWRAFL